MPHAPNPREQLENARKLRELAERGIDEAYERLTDAVEEEVKAENAYRDWRKETGQE